MLDVVISRWIYWVNSGTPQIERASLDGTSRTVLHSTGLISPHGLTIDYDTQTLYWTDYSLDNLESSHVNGTGRRVLTKVNVACPYSITFFDNKLYWGDTCYRVIYSTHINSPLSVTTLSSTGNNPYRIRVISEKRQPISGKIYTYIPLILFMIILKIFMDLMALYRYKLTVVTLQWNLS